MLIANPIYDVVFKYLMEDAKVAKIMLSSIIGESISKLSFLPQEFTTEIDTQSVKKTHKTGLTVYRLDFSAQIQTPEGQKQVIIELQKAKFPTDIIRFRRYLGEQFNDPRNIISKNGRRTNSEWLPGDNMGSDSYIWFMRELARDCLSVCKADRSGVGGLRYRPVLRRKTGGGWR